MFDFNEKNIKHAQFGDDSNINNVLKLASANKLTNKTNKL